MDYLIKVKMILEFTSYDNNNIPIRRKSFCKTDGLMYQPAVQMVIDFPETQFVVNKISQNAKSGELTLYSYRSISRYTDFEVELERRTKNLLENRWEEMDV